MVLLIQELEWGQRNSMVKEEKFLLNKETGEEIEIKNSDFEFVQKDKKIHDVKFSTKTTTFFKDSLKRFAKSKSAIVGGAIVGLLVVCAIIIPSVMPSVGAFDVDRDSAGGNVNERYVQPKLFASGTGFWDGTIKKKKILYNKSTQTPNGYREGVFKLNGEPYESFENSSGALGEGGYVNVFCIDGKTTGTLFSDYVDFDFSNEYTINTTLLNEEVSGYKLSSYRIILETMDKEVYYLTDNGEYITDNSLNINVNEILEKNSYDQILSEGVNARIKFQVQSIENTKGNILIQDFSIKSNNASDPISEELATISFSDANSMLIKKSDQDGFWGTTSGKAAYKVKFTYCDFTYDQYEDIYGIQPKTMTSVDLLALKNDKELNINLSGMTVPATSDKEELAKRFEIVGDNSTIYEVIEQIGDAKYNSKTKQYEGYTLLCRVRGYKLYGYDSMPLFLFGTNNNRKDYFKLIFTGLRFSFLLAIGVSFVNIVFGLVWGSISGYFGGWTDILMERFCEILSGIPSTVLITLCILYGAEWGWGNSSDVIALMIALFMTGWMGVSGRTRTQFYRFKGREYVLASRTLGAKDSRLIFRHILPNSMGTIITGSILMIPSVIYTEASIAYLGLGLSGQVMFGVILSEGNSNYTGENTYILIIPTIIMAMLLISFNLFGNGLRDAFNPTLKGEN